MTTATFLVREDGIYGFSVRGHSGFAAEGSDILCAAITSAVRLTECTICDVLKIQARVEVEEGVVTLELPPTLGKGDGNEQLLFSAKAQLRGMALYFRQLQQEYPKYLVMNKKSL